MSKRKPSRLPGRFFGPGHAATAQPANPSPCVPIADFYERRYADGAPLHITLDQIELANSHAGATIRQDRRAGFRPAAARSVARRRDTLRFVV